MPRKASSSLAEKETRYSIRLYIHICRRTKRAQPEGMENTNEILDTVKKQRGRPRNVDKLNKEIEKEDRLPLSSPTTSTRSKSIPLSSPILKDVTLPAVSVKSVSPNSMSNVKDNDMNIKSTVESTMTNNALELKDDAEMSNNNNENINLLPTPLISSTITQEFNNFNFKVSDESVAAINYSSDKSSYGPVVNKNLFRPTPIDRPVSKERIIPPIENKTIPTPTGILGNIRGAISSTYNWFFGKRENINAPIVSSPPEIFNYNHKEMIVESPNPSRVSFVRPMPSTLTLSNNEKSAFSSKNSHAPFNNNLKNDTKLDTEFKFENLPIAPKVTPQPIILPVEPTHEPSLTVIKESVKENIVTQSAQKSLRFELEARMNSDEKFTPDDVLHYLNLMQQRLVQKDNKKENSPAKIHVHYMEEDDHVPHTKTYPKTPHPQLATPLEKKSNKRVQSEVNESPDQIKETIFHTPAPKSTKLSESEVSKGHTANRILETLNKISKPVSTPLPTPLSEAKRFRVAPPTFLFGSTSRNMDPYVRRGLVSANLETSSSENKIEIKKTTPEPAFSFVTTSKAISTPAPITGSNQFSNFKVFASSVSATPNKSAFPSFNPNSSFEVSNKVITSSFNNSSSFESNNDENENDEFDENANEEEEYDNEEEVVEDEYNEEEDEPLGLKMASNSAAHKWSPEKKQRDVSKSLAPPIKKTSEPLKILTSSQIAAQSQSQSKLSEECPDCGHGWDDADHSQCEKPGVVKSNLNLISNKVSAFPTTNTTGPSFSFNSIDSIKPSATAASFSAPDVAKPSALPFTLPQSSSSTTSSFSFSATIPPETASSLTASTSAPVLASIAVLPKSVVPAKTYAPLTILPPSKVAATVVEDEEAICPVCEFGMDDVDHSSCKDDKPAAASTSTFSFGNTASSTTTAPIPSFSFQTASSSTASITAAAPAPKFEFNLGTKPGNVDSNPKFSFNIPSNTASSAASKPLDVAPITSVPFKPAVTPNFQFNVAPSVASTASSTPSFSFASSSSLSATTAPNSLASSSTFSSNPISTTISKPLFEVNPTPAFSFNTSTTSKPVVTSITALSSSSSSFNIAPVTAPFSLGSTKPAAHGFPGISSSAPASSQMPASQPSFSFSTSISNGPTNFANQSANSFSFPGSSAPNTQPSFSFSTSSSAAPVVAGSTPAFSFNASTTSTAATSSLFASPASTPVNTGFSFTSTAPAPETKSSFGIGGFTSASSSSAFPSTTVSNTSTFGGFGGFGASAPVANTTSNFGASTSSAFGGGSSSFGGTNTFGTNTSSFGASSPSFGGSSNFGTSSSSFGGSASFGASTSSFGGASTNFGASSSSFNPSPNFGNSVPTFGGNSTFGVGGFSSSPTPTTTAFGSSFPPASNNLSGGMSFGTPQPSFGGSSFGASSATPFGAPSQPAAFGGFGSQPSANFGGSNTNTPTSTLPNTGFNFDAPAGGGFSMGASSDKSKRQFVKAKRG